MIDARELRIGNLVFNDLGQLCVIAVVNDIDSFVQVRNRETKNVEEYTFEQIQPIELSEEWLIKFGFENSGKVPYKFILIDKETSLEIVDPSTIDPNKESIWWVVLFQHDRSGRELNLEDIDSVSLKSLKHVHQLQNLCFAHTGQELTMK